ncbi:enoyl-CoA hydratase-related protein [Thalassovita sp.]|uniref:enoyl-CoA hydratase-related protein n=1 Tax=Thalassovita sp. TaxID=1979401 RepID=UPI0029DE72B9|nr:enoyl-CoA hydratase-related protein [Thalassovita sp.]
MNQMNTPTLVQADLSDKVLTLTLGNGVAHPLSLAMIAELHAQISDASTDPQVHAIVIHGPGKIFCAGHDLKEIAAHRAAPDDGLDYLTELFTTCGDLMQAIAGSTKPTIALVEGIATAGGLQLMASCDLAFAADRATFCLPGVTNGGFCTTPAVAVSRNIPRKQVMDLALSGDTFDAEWALNAGLISRILPADEVIDFTMDYARKLAARHAPAIASGKAALLAHAGLPLDQAYALATPVMIGHFMDPYRMEKERKR